MRFNDGRCDRQGRFFAGTMLRDMAAAAPAGALYRLDGAGSAAQLSPPLVDGLIVPKAPAATSSPVVALATAPSLTAVAVIHEPTTYSETDDGNALRLVDTHGNAIRYVPQRGQCLVTL